MANKPIVMSKLRRVLQLYKQGKSKLFISNYLALSRNTVNKYTTQSLLLNKSTEELLTCSDVDLEKLFTDPETRRALGLSTTQSATIAQWLPEGMS